MVGWWRWALISPDGVAPSRTVCLPLLIFPCTIKSRSSLLAPVHSGGPGKGAVKRLCVCVCKPRDWLGRMYLNWPILCRVGHKTLTQSIHWQLVSDLQFSVSYLPDRPDIDYNLREHHHNKTLILKIADLNERNFLIHNLYRRICWL